MDPRDHHPHRTREFENIQCPDHTWRMVCKKQKILQSKVYKQSTTYNTKYQVCTPTSSTSMTKHIYKTKTHNKKTTKINWNLKSEKEGRCYDMAIWSLFKHCNGHSLMSVWTYIYVLTDISQYEQTLQSEC